jgi:hypothetical protein
LTLPDHRCAISSREVVLVPTRYVKDIVVDPATAALMRKAFASALAKLTDAGVALPNAQAEWARETLALRIIETVQKRNERDFERVRDDALLHLAESRPPHSSSGSGTE